MAPRDDLQSKWIGSGRFSCFGDAITRLTLEGIRCHHRTSVDIASPITAFSGLNGTGKSTLLQMAAVGYRNTHFRNTYYVRNFLVASSLDPTPFDPASASIAFDFCDQPANRRLTISYDRDRTGWSGYERRRERAVFLCGIGNYLPRIERRDFVIRNARQLEVVNTTDQNSTIKAWTCHVLGQQYTSVRSSVVSHGDKQQQVGILNRDGRLYSEAHMGFGEGRAQFLIQSLETLPEKSLALIEEPETSLHQRAQFGLGQYLVDVCNRRGHQILLTTHSQYLMNALHYASRVFLYHEAGRVNSLSGLAASQANSLLTQGFEKALTILVEDECARILLAELIRRVDQTFLSTVAIVVGGSATDLLAAARAMRTAPLKIAVVRDGDKGGDPRNHIYKLPGTKPPEKELLEDAAIQDAMNRRFGGNAADVLALNSLTDHHQWFDRIAESVSSTTESLIDEASRAYALSGSLANEVTVLVNQLKDSASR
jgi:predicted ATP-dependent endonuclease of OLD family